MTETGLNEVLADDNAVINGIRVGGSVTLFHFPEWMDWKTIEDGFDRIGLSQYKPTKTTKLRALHEAVTESFRTSSHVVRSLGAKVDGYCVVRESKGDRANSYDVIVSVVLEPTSQGIIFDWKSGIPDVQVETDILDKTTVYMDKVHSSAVAISLRNILTKKLDGTSPRPAGGIYWISQQHLPKWEEVKAVVEAAGTGAHVSVFRHPMGPLEVDAIMHAITVDVSKSVEDLHEQVTSGDIGHRAIEGKMRILDKICEKVSRYEEITSRSLPALKDLVHNAKSAALIAKMAAKAEMVKEEEANAAV